MSLFIYIMQVDIVYKKQVDSMILTSVINVFVYVCAHVQLYLNCKSKFKEQPFLIITFQKLFYGSDHYHNGIFKHV